MFIKKPKCSLGGAGKRSLAENELSGQWPSQNSSSWFGLPALHAKIGLALHLVNWVDKFILYDSLKCQNNTTISARKVMRSFTAIEFGVTETQGGKCTSQNSENLERPYRKNFKRVYISEISVETKYTHPLDVHGPYIL